MWVFFSSLNKAVPLFHDRIYLYISLSFWYTPICKIPCLKHWLCKFTNTCCGCCNPAGKIQCDGYYQVRLACFSNIENQWELRALEGISDSSSSKIYILTARLFYPNYSSRCFCPCCSPLTPCSSASQKLTGVNSLSRNVLKPHSRSTQVSLKLGTRTFWTRSASWNKRR